MNHSSKDLFLSTMDKIEYPNQPSKTIVFDTETTGVDFTSDEIIQLSILDLDGNTIFSSFIKPYDHEDWSAKEINGIHPEMVKSAPYPHEVAPLVRGIFKNANHIIAYNADFDIQFLERWGVDFSGKRITDVMVDFAPIYGDWSEYWHGFKWQKLTVCARYYGYKFDPHNALEDTKAPLFCYLKMHPYRTTPKENGKTD